ncbi:NADH:flavin oxidoreductase [Achlya hypogyna]|uniref:NADH:flavin oxidoreductase n=1 Tax=Achlya hypogyna TaxID=1202772 RepID=A0A1V9YYI7_ACHHY|nr:NADH:flavin oxidoreductase [Achlya hypogyna]
MSSLFTPLTVGSLQLPNRVFMAPLTRCRATPDTHVPIVELIAPYYAARATAGLIIAECSMIAPGASAFYAEPGVYSLEQLAAWKVITDAVHAQGGKIFCQIWHAGRAAHPELNRGAETVSSSAVVMTKTTHTPFGKAAPVTPRALGTHEVDAVVQLFAVAARNCVELGGFDGVEIHGANGYLVDQFLKDGVNRREDSYGGCVENRVRFLMDVLAAVGAAIGFDKLAVRLAPLNTENDIADSDPFGLATHVANALNELPPLAYVHILRHDLLGQLQGDVEGIFRRHYKGVLVSNASYTRDEANTAIATGRVDAIAFGKPFIANPDLVARFQQSKVELNDVDRATFYKGGAVGYLDYPTLVSSVAP